MSEFMHYAPIIIVILACLLQWHIVVTPEQLERKHREILREIAERYMTKESARNLETEISEIKDKINKIYDKIIGG